MDQTFLDYIRHLTRHDSKTLSQKALKTCEEVGELARVVLPYDNAFATNHRFVDRERILEEAADVVLTALSIAYHLDFSDSEVDDMLCRKAEKWAQLQSKECDLKYPLPYEIHITVKLDDKQAIPDQLQAFMDVCKAVGVKPIVLDLENQAVSVMTDVMTSSKHFGTNRTAFEEALRISTHLSKFNVVRTKIETVPWHPAAPRDQHDTMPPNCYFESHIPVVVTEDQLPMLRSVCGRNNMHLSRNVFKRNPDGTVVVMTTYRDSKLRRQEFEAAVMYRELVLKDYGFVIQRDKMVVEFSVYDTKVSHDASWLATP